MNALNKAARIVENAWCKGDFAERSDDGDRFCANGAIMAAMGVKWQYTHKYESGGKYFIEGEYPTLNGEAIDVWSYLNGTSEAKAMVKVIEENHPEIKRKHFDNDKPLADTDYIFSFNDNDDITREDVVAMLEKAATYLD